jgi:hypothetical protein
MQHADPFVAVIKVSLPGAEQHNIFQPILFCLQFLLLGIAGTSCHGNIVMLP